jgi:hypothetical protein
MTASRFKALVIGVVAGATGALSASCNLEPSAVDKPTYEADVRPILMSRCIRCHGSPPLGDPTASPPSGSPVPTVRFDVFGDTNCGTDAGTGCVHGAAFEAMQNGFKTFLVDRAGSALAMPPPPAPKLTSYQLDTILKWESESPPLEK